MSKVIDSLYIKEIPEEVRNFITTNNLTDINTGRYSFNNGVYLNIDLYDTKLRSMSKYEAHRKFIDVQYVISGEEIVCIDNISNLNILEEYDDIKDCIFYSNDNRGKDYVLHAGEGLIIYPEDGHIPGLQLIEGEPKKVKKMVIKIPITQNFQPNKSFDEVRVSYSQDKKPKFNSLAYTQSTDIYVGPGHEKYLQHDLSHVVNHQTLKVSHTDIKDIMNNLEHEEL